VSAPKDGKKIIIVRKKVVGHGGHHGGSWKVAYADFVTAMMAFFLVMWILGMDQNLKQSIEGYFSNPVGFKKGYSAGRSPVSAGSSPGTVQSSPIKLLSRTAEERTFREAEKQIREKLEERGLGKLGARLQVVVTKQGLRIEISEGENGDTFFALGSAHMTSTMEEAMLVIGEELRLLPNPVILEGHTDASQYSGDYSNWELSSDRANAARRVLERAGLAARRVTEVRGLADRQLKFMDDPLDPRNRRITVFLPFRTEAPTAAPLAPPIPGERMGGQPVMEGRG